MTAVGSVGLGAMGTPMAWNLDDAGFDLTASNRTTERERRFAEAGVSVADSPKHLMERADVVCLIGYMAAVVKHLGETTDVEVRGDESR